jgi:sugar phosphate isomerase/epimerase
MVHVRDIAVQPDSKGRPAAWWPSVPLGCGDVAVAAVLERMGAPHGAGWFVEMSTMHPNHPDEDDAVRRSLAFLRDLAV